MIKKVACITNGAPHYRAKLWLEMLSMKELEIHFFCDTTRSAIRQIAFDETWNAFRHRVHPVTNVRFRSVVMFQIGVLFKLVTGRWDAVVVLGDMFVISNWMIALLVKLKGKRIFFWGHGLYGNEGVIKLLLRRSFLSLAHEHFLYGDHAKTLMIKQGFASEHLHIVYNSLDYALHKSIRQSVLDKAFYKSRQYFTDNSLPILIFIGRLTPVKRIDLLIDAVANLKAKGVLLNLVIIGEGSEVTYLKRKSTSISGQAHFYGACYEDFEIGRLIANADLCVSPGNVGLTAIHSLSFGTPVCTNGDMTMQMPEAEAVVSGVTGIHSDGAGLEAAIEKWFSVARNRDQIRSNCYHIIDSRYNPYFQTGVFKKVLLSW